MAVTIPTRLAQKRALSRSRKNRKNGKALTLGEFKRKLNLIN